MEGPLRSLRNLILTVFTLFAMTASSYGVVLTTSFTSNNGFSGTSLMS